MKFWKEHTTLRVVLMLATFAGGFALMVYGWTMTGKMNGLLLMLLGLALLLTTLALYNKPFEDPKPKKSPLKFNGGEKV